MLTSVPIGVKKLNAYKEIVGKNAISEIRALAAPLKGLKVLHINSTAFGGGVAELLFTLVPLMKNVGLDTDWQVISAPREFFEITKLIHNGLQGMDIPWTTTMAKVYLDKNAENAKALEGQYDIVVIHDPQPAAILHFLKKQRRKVAKKWVWRCHIDLTYSDFEIWQFLKPYVEEFDAAIFTVDRYVKEDLNMDTIAIIPPAIDPFSPKNMPLDNETIRAILNRFSIDPDKPIVTQVARFDPWKDPLGVVDAYRLMKKEVTDLQLLMVASMATDDPEGWHYFEKIARHSGEDFNIYLLSNLQGVGNVEVNAIQRSSDVVLQKSKREGFGLTVAEALWKKKPVVAGYAGGIPLQILNGKNGFLINSVEECAEKTVELLRDKSKANHMGEFGKQRVKEKFISTINLQNYLKLFNLLRSSMK